MMVRTLEPVSGTPTVDVLEEQLAVLCGYRNALDAQLVALTATALETGVWEQSGIISPAHWLAWKAGLSTAHARQVVRLARRRAGLPVTFAAFDAGELSIDQVAPIVAEVPAYADRELCEFAKLATVTQLRRTVRSYGFDPDPTPRPEPADAEPGERGDGGDGEPGDLGDDAEPGGAADLRDPQPETRPDPKPDLQRDPDPQPKPGSRSVDEWVSLSHLEDGSWQLAGRLDADHGAIVEAALREARDALFQRDGHRASAVDGLVEIANRSLDTISDPARRDRYRVHVHLDPDNTMIDGWGRRLPGWLRDLICCDTTWSTVNHHDGLPVSVGRTQRTIPERTRRLVVLRDRGCRVPGCATERVLQVHHIIHWDPDDGEGPTDTWNLICLCPRHHRMHHRGLLGISGYADDPHGLTFTDTHGRPIPPGPRPRPPTGPPPPPTGRYRHPLGERLQTRWVVFNPPRPTPTTTHTN